MTHTGLPRSSIRLVLVGLLCAAAPARAETWRALPGTLRVPAAEPAERGHVGVAATGVFLRQDGLLSAGERITQLSGRLAATWAALPWLRLGGGSMAATTRSTRLDGSVVAMGDFDLLAAGAWSLNDKVAAGARLGVRLYTGEGSAAFAWGATSPSLEAHATLAPMPSRPMRVHVALGGVLDRSGEAASVATDLERFALGLREDPYWTLGIAADYSVRRFSPYLELTTEQAIGGPGFADCPGRVTVGSRARLGLGWSFNLGVDVGVTGTKPQPGVPTAPAWALVLGLHYDLAKALGGRAPEPAVEAASAPPAHGSVVGRILLDGGKKPGGGAIVRGRPATLSPPAHHARRDSARAKLEAVRFEARGLPPGRYAVEVSLADHVAPPAAEVEVKAGEETRVDLHMSAMPLPGSVTGFAVDGRGTGVPAVVVLVLESGEERRTGTDPFSGHFRLDSPGGQHRLRVLADGFEPVGKSVTVEPGSEEGVLLRLRRAATAVAEARVRDDRIEHTGAVVFKARKSKLKKASYPALLAVAELLGAQLEITRVRIEVLATDVADADKAAKVAAKRAKACVKYLVKQGVDPGRLEAAPGGTAPTTAKPGQPPARNVVFRVLERSQPKPAPATPVGP